MKTVNKQALLAFAVASLAAATAHAEVVDGGTVHFNGELVNAACAVSVESADQTVNLGQYRTATFQQVGAYSARIPFTIELTDCDTTVSQNASAAFYGQMDQTDPTLLAVASATNATTATGVGIEIRDSADQVLTPDGTNFSTPQQLIDGNNTLAFSASYKSTAATTTAGQANADATFVMQYL